MQAENFHSWLKVFSEQAFLLNERRLIILSGSESWALTLLNNSVISPELNSQKTDENFLVYGDSQVFPANVPAKRFRDKLGSESKQLIFADSQFRIDALAALSGTIKAGGILFILMPEEINTKPTSPFVKRFLRVLDSFTPHVLIKESDAQLPVITLDSREIIEPIGKKPETFAYSCATVEQLGAVQAIKKVATGHRKRPLVLTADRGRGKSSALAIACVQLLVNARKDNALRIIITAPDRQSLSVFFHQLLVSLPDLTRQENMLYYGNSCIEFHPVDQLLKHNPEASLLLVDEAAAIPVYQLEQLLTVFHRTVFSSTVHGYEGAGRGFTLKFQKKLAKLCPHWQSLHLNEPIRWRIDDPLERFIFDACLLNSELQSYSIDHKYSLELFDTAALVCELYTGEDLSANEGLLREVFAILVTAHYQTKPSDVKLLLDNTQVQLVCLKTPDSTLVKGQVVAVALVLKEGSKEFNTDAVNIAQVSAVKNAQSRLKNHFLPQSLLTHCGFESAFHFTYFRVMRIAVHPQLQNQGIGGLLLTEIEQLADKQNIDFIGASFGLNVSLLSFWLTAGMQVSRIGFTKDKASGEHSVMVLKGMNSSSHEALKYLNEEFYRCFDFLLADEYKTLNADLVLLLLKQCSTTDSHSTNSQQALESSLLSPLDLANVQAFAQGQRLYSSCAYSLYRWLKFLLLKNNSLLPTPELLALISRLLQKHTINELCQHYGYTGKKMLEKKLKEYVQQQLLIVAKGSQ